MEYIAGIVLGYLSGSLMFAYWIPKLIKGIDIRQLSKDQNPGTANAFTYAGAGCGILVLICELCKGMVPVWVAAQVLDIHHPAFILVMAAPVFGHGFPAFFGMKNGGKSIAVSFGVLLGLLPLTTPVFLLVFWYLLFSLVIVIDPHGFRTAAAFVCWSISQAFWVKNSVIVLASVLITGLVLEKHGEELRQKEQRKIHFVFRKE